MDKNTKKLIKQSLNGSLDAFGMVVSRYQNNVCAVTYSITGDISASEDLAQETFIAAWQGLGTIEDTNSFLPWLCGIARNKAYNWLKKTARHKATSITEVPEPAAPDKSGDIELKEQYGDLLWSAVGELEDNYREPLVMYYRNNKSIKEVAISLELSEAAVRQRLNRARKMLRSQVADKIEDMIRDTGPGKMFSGAVVSAIISAGLAESAAAGTVVSASSSSTSASSGFFFTLAGKALVTAVVAVTITAALVTFALQAPKVKPKLPDFRQSVPILEPNRIDNIANTADLPVSGSPSETTTEKAAQSVQKSKQMPECVYAYCEEREKHIELWVKGDKKWRFKADDYEQICDGVKVLELDNRNNTASFVKNSLNKPNDISEVLVISKMISDNLNLQKEVSMLTFAGRKCIARKSDNVKENNEIVFDIHKADNDELLCSAWIDSQTARVNYFEGLDSNDRFTADFCYDFIDDDVFSTAIPSGFDLEESSSISGFVLDEYGQIVTDATVYIDGSTAGPTKKLATKTDQYGYFECFLDFDGHDRGIGYPVAIRAVSESRPELVAWSVIPDPDIKITDRPQWLGRLDTDVVVRKKKVLGRELCASIQNLVMYMEPGGTISGVVTDKAGNPIEKAQVIMSISGFIPTDKVSMSVNFRGLRGGLITSTNSEGYYELLGVPKLKGNEFDNKGFMKSYQFNVSAENYCYINETANDGRSCESIGNEVYNFKLSAAVLTLSGRLIDDHGNPLSYYQSIYVSEDKRNWYPSMRLDGQGCFTIKNAPFAKTLFLKKDSRDDSYSWQYDNDSKNIKFIPYAEKIFEIQCPEGVREYDTGDLVMEFPDITAEVHVVNPDGEPVGSVECGFEAMGSRELLQDRYWKTTDKKEGKCVFENLPRINSGPPITGTGNIYCPISLRPSEKESGSEYFSTDYHFKYPGDHKHYIFELVLPRRNHPGEHRRMRVYSPDGALLLETNGD